MKRGQSNKEANAETIAKFLVEQIICRQGCPKVIQSDQGSIFTSGLFQEISKYLGIRHNISTSFHPQTQGLVERSHSTLNDCISMYVSKDQKDWDIFLNHIVFAINSSVQETTGYSPFYLLYGREALLPLEAELTTQYDKNSPIGDMIEKVQSARLIAMRRIQDRQDVYARRYDAKRKQANFKVGDKVLVRRCIQKKAYQQNCFIIFTARTQLFARLENATMN